MKKIGRSSYLFENTYLKASATVAGPKEGDGPIGHYFDQIISDLYNNEKTYEKCEIKMVKTVIDLLLNKANINKDNIDLAIAGDLINQNVIANYALRDYEIPFIGIYNACATSTLGLIIASTFTDSYLANNVLTFTSSHNATAERQYRYPTEYGGQKPDSATYTVTGSGGAIVSNEKSKIMIKKATIGTIFDYEENDPFDMGSAMAPAAFHTLKTHFNDFKIKPSEYDLILTGDLSTIGKNILLDLFKNTPFDMTKNYNDCGLLVYDVDYDSVFSGGSGAGCSSLVTFSYVVNGLKNGIFKKVLICATGALMNPIMINQKETIPAIAHAVSLEVE